MKLKKFIKSEKGATMPLVAIILGLFALGFIALVIDAGILYVDRKKMITAADAAALAGAQVLRESGGTNVSEAELTAKKYALANGAEESQVEIYVGPKSVTLPNGSTETRHIVEATVGVNEPLIFARFLEDDDADVKANAIATWGYVHTTYIGNFIPIFTFDIDYQLNTDIFLHDRMDGTNSYGFIDIEGGMNNIKEAIAGNFVGGSYIYNNLLDGKPGNGASLEGAVVDRMLAAQEKATAEERKKFMIGLVPIIDYDKFMELNGDKLNQSSAQWSLPIKYFAYYEIEDVIKQNEIEGSEEALNPANEYLRKGIPRFNYEGRVPESLLNNQGDGVKDVTIVGRFTGEIVEARTIVELGDQLNPNPDGDTPAMYSKLIK